MSKYVISYSEETQISTVNVDLICKDWNDRFFISTWGIHKGQKFSFIVKPKGRAGYVDVLISEEQAKEIIAKMKLILLPHLRGSGSYLTEMQFKKEARALKQYYDKKHEIESDECNSLFN